MRKKIMPRKHKIINDSSPSTSNVLINSRRHSSIEQRKAGFQDKKMPKSAGRGELKGLQDSLSKFFTPSDMRRSRTNSFKVNIDQHLEVDVDFPNKVISRSESKSSRTNSVSSHISPKSPHHRDRLEDALTKYFTPNPDKRRLHKEGEYWQLSKGGGSDFQRPKISAEHTKIGEADGADERGSGKILTQQQQSSKHSFIGDDERPHLPKQKQVLERRENNSAAFKSAQLIKRAYKGGRGSRKQQPISSFFKISNGSSLLPSQMKFKPFNASISSKLMKSDILPKFSDDDRILFEQARRYVMKDLELANNALKLNEKSIFPSKIRIHCYEIDTWYSAPYPQEYACLPVLHICDACLMYLSVPSCHMRKCKQRFPPGNEIYRDSTFSVFEVDGNLARVYCRNLCLLAKLFIDHKTLYFDVEPFLFYVLTLNDETGCHFVGYFSKEKFSHQKYNLACIVTLPCYQGRGFGRFLIEFSYALSKREGLIGSPERPLSDLGKIAYHNYWLYKLFDFFCERYNVKDEVLNKISLNEISIATGISPSDIAETLAENLMLPTKDSKTFIVLDKMAICSHKKLKESKKHILLDENKLIWEPKIYSPSKDLRVQSPLRTPLPITPQKDKLDDEVLMVHTVQTSDLKNKNNISTLTGRGTNKILKRVNTNKKISKILPTNVGRKRTKLKSKNGRASSTKSREVLTSESEPEEEEKFPLKQKRRGRSKKVASTCKNAVDKRRKNFGSSSDDEKIQQSKSILAQNGSQTTCPTTQSSITPSTSQNIFSSNKCIISSPHGNQNNLSLNKEISINLTTDNEEKKKIEDSTDSENERSSKRKKIFENKINEIIDKKKQVESEETDISSHPSSPSIPKRKKFLSKNKMRGAFQKRRNVTSSSSSSTDESSFGFDSEKNKRINNDKMSNEIRPKKSLFQQSVCSEASAEEENEVEEEEEEEDRSFCSSISPQPLGDLPPLKEHENLINMGGEPDTINMGGEPENDDMGTANSFSTVGISSYKAPVLITAHPMEADDEDEELFDEPPTVDEQRNEHLLGEFSQNINIGESVNEQRLDSTLKGFSVDDKKNSLKIPTIRVDFQQKSVSPSDVTAVEMPALDAAERHISSAENICRFGDDELVEDDAPPMLSPQAQNSENLTCRTATTTTSLQNTLKPIVTTSSLTTTTINDEDSFKINETSYHSLNEGLQNTSSSSASSGYNNIVFEQVHDESDSFTQQQKDSLNVIKPVDHSNNEGDNNSPQIRVRSESNVEFCNSSTASKLQRTCSFSGGAAQIVLRENINNSNNLNSMQSLHRPPEISLPSINVQNKTILSPSLQPQPQMIELQQQSSTFLQPTQQQQFTNVQQTSNSTSFYDLSYDQQQFLQQQSKMLQGQGQITTNNTTITTTNVSNDSNIEKKKKSRVREGKSTSSSDKKRSQRQQISQQANVQNQNVVSMPSTSSMTGITVPTFQSSQLAVNMAAQAAQFANYYQQQQQYPYIGGSVNNNIGRQGITNADFCSAQMNPYLYNQAAWQAWQMSAKFQQNQQQQAAYTNFPYEIFNSYNMMTNGVGEGGPAIISPPTSSTTAAMMMMQQQHQQQQFWQNNNNINNNFVKMVDLLFDVRNNYYLGAYQQCINEAQVVKCNSEEDMLKKDIFLYRAYIALKKSSIPLNEIDSSSGLELLALRRLAEYFNNVENRATIVRDITDELELVDTEGNEHVNLFNATILLNEDDAENALRSLSRISGQSSLECLAIKIQCLLKLWRIDLALVELKKMQEVDEDATIVQLATAWIYMAMGKDKIKDAFYIFQEMIDKYGSTPTLLVSQSSCLIQQQKYENAEKLLMDAQQRDPNNPEALIGLYVIANFLGKQVEVSNRYLNQLKQDHPAHIWTKDFVTKEMEIDR
ncbi:Histone acetyltransferase [Meloidogyne graminicola]|uniref:histone acetyltransferase n=1 Tax=Meloidogyne graminicola TaxID=189291 RepID=A0A8S9ZMP8_9BILA|nr:Histone acetyltransferase [Meloidogyne graminicola]